MEYMNSIVADILQPGVIAATFVSLLFIVKMAFLSDSDYTNDEEK